MRLSFSISACYLHIIFGQILPFGKCSAAFTISISIIVLITIPQQIIGRDVLSLLGEGGLEGVTRFDADVFGAKVVLPILNIRIDNYCRLDESLFYVSRSLCARLEKYQIMFVGEFLALLSRHLSLKFEITLVAHQ